MSASPSQDYFALETHATGSGTSTPTSLEGSSSSLSGYSTPATERSLELAGVDEVLPERRLDSRVLIVGGLGFIGSHTAWELLKVGQSVVIVDNLSNSYISVLQTLRQMTKDRYQGGPSVPGIDFHEMDFCDTMAMQEMLSQYTRREPGVGRVSLIKGVIHFAAYKAVEESIRQPLKYYANNVSGLISLCSLLDRNNIKTFIFSSSATVYGELANSGGRLREELCSHTTTRWTDSDGAEKVTLSGCTGLTNPYGRTKWIGEAILSDLAASDRGWKILALRYFNPVGCDESGWLGEDPRGAPNNLMPVLIQAMTGQRSTLNIFGSDWDTRDGTAVRDFIHVSDLARGHLAALSTATEGDLTSGFHVINLGTGNGQTVSEVVEAMEGVLGREIPTQMVARRDGDVGICIAETTRAEQVLGWKAEKTIEDSCRDVVRFLKLDRP